VVETETKFILLYDDTETPHLLNKAFKLKVTVMKTMSCKQLGGSCDIEFHAETFEEMAELSKAHGMAMFQKQDKAHLEAMSRIQALMKTPGAMQEWFDSKRKEFDALADN
jgi:ribosomal protein L7Ae-like RNA K-turn-binding protein